MVGRAWPFLVFAYFEQVISDSYGEAGGTGGHFQREVWETAAGP